jgi:glycosyltransferase involved in cell wall biosynthesis
MAEVYAREFGCRSTVIPYCFPALDWTPSHAPVERLGLTPDRYAVIAGRLNPENNIDTIAAAYAASDLPLPLLVLGAANYDSPVERRLHDLAARDRRIRPIGHVENRHDFLSLLRFAAVYIHGHSVGGLNPALIEATGAMAQVAALDTPFNREALGPEGRLFAPDLHDFASVIKDVLARSDDERAAARTSAADRVCSLYDLASVVDAYEDVLVAAAQARPRPLISIPTKWSRGEDTDRRSHRAALDAPVSG